MIEFDVDGFRVVPGNHDVITLQIDHMSVESGSKCLEALIDEAVLEPSDVLEVLYNVMGNCEDMAEFVVEKENSEIILDQLKEK